VWFHKLRSHKKGIAEIQVSHKLMPFLVELSSQYTAYSLRGNVLKKNGVKCTNFAKKWQGTDGFRISVDELRKAFILEEIQPVCASK
jgi:plasmid replication initiation protein